MVDVFSNEPQDLTMEEARELYFKLQRLLGPDSWEFNAVLTLMSDCANRAIAEIEEMGKSNAVTPE
jgi:hypothetical protein